MIVSSGDNKVVITEVDENNFSVTLYKEGVFNLVIWDILNKESAMELTKKLLGIDIDRHT